jgi:hypothetical protein
VLCNTTNKPASAAEGDARCLLYSNPASNARLLVLVLVLLVLLLLLSSLLKCSVCANVRY